MQNGRLGWTCLSADLKSEIVNVAFYFSLFALDVDMLVEFVQKKKELFPSLLAAVARLIDVAAGGQLWDNIRDAGLRLVLFCIFLKDTVYLRRFIYIYIYRHLYTVNYRYKIYIYIYM